MMFFRLAIFQATATAFLHTYYFYLSTGGWLKPCADPSLFVFFLPHSPHPHISIILLPFAMSRSPYKMPNHGDEAYLDSKAPSSPEQSPLLAHREPCAQHPRYKSAMNELTMTLERQSLTFLRNLHLEQAIPLQNHDGVKFC